MVVLGLILLAAGVVTILAGVLTAENAAGVVQVLEGRIAYFGPLTGGVADLDRLDRLMLDPSARPPHWLLRSDDGTTLAIPLTAEGADQLFDAFATLPDLRTERMLALMQKPGAGPVMIWQAPRAAAAALRLH